MLWLSAGSCESVIGETGYRRSVGGGRMGALRGAFGCSKDVLVEHVS